MGLALPENVCAVIYKPKDRFIPNGFVIYFIPVDNRLYDGQEKNIYQAVIPTYLHPVRHINTQHAHSSFYGITGECCQMQAQYFFILRFSVGDRKLCIKLVE